MSVPDTPSPRTPRSPVTALLLIGGFLLLAPGICTVIFAREYTSSPNPVPGDIMQLWIISFIISAVGITLIICFFRSPAPTFSMVVIGNIVLLSGLCALYFMAHAALQGGASAPLFYWLWMLCVVISAGSILLLYQAFHKKGAP